MNKYLLKPTDNSPLSAFLNGKSDYAMTLLEHFINQFNMLNPVFIHPTKSMLGIGNADKSAVWVTQIGKNFVHIVFAFRESHPDNLCFTKIAQVPGDANQFNHHFRMYQPDDINEEVLHYMTKACNQ